MKLPANLLLFDGTCLFCDATVRLVCRFNTPQRADSARLIHFAQLQTIAANAALMDAVTAADPHLTAVVHDVNSVVLIETSPSAGSVVYLRSAAAFRVAMKFDNRVLRTLASAAYYGIPTRIADAVYLAVARRRYRLFGRSETCLRPTAEMKTRVWRGDPDP